MIVYSHPDCLLKFNGQGHPERKERLDSILKSIKSSDLKVEFKEAPKVDLETVSLVHPKKHIEQIFANIPKEGIIGVEKEPYADTMLCPNSENAMEYSIIEKILKENELGKNYEIWIRLFPLLVGTGMHASQIQNILKHNFCLDG